METGLNLIGDGEIKHLTPKMRLRNQTDVPELVISINLADR